MIKNGEEVNKLFSSQNCDYLKTIRLSARTSTKTARRSGPFFHQNFFCVNSFFCMIKHYQPYVNLITLPLNCKTPTVTQITSQITKWFPSRAFKFKFELILIIDKDRFIHNMAYEKSYCKAPFKHLD